MHLPATKSRPTTADTEGDLKRLKIAAIKPHPDQPRDDAPAADIDQLAESIRDHGLLEPIVVRPLTAGRFQIIAGERRYRAVKQLGKKTIAATVREMTDTQAFGAMLVENHQRRALNPIQTAHGIERLRQAAEDSGQPQTLAQIGRMFGRSETWAGNMIRLLKLPKNWLRKIEAGDLKPSNAEPILPYANNPDVLDAIERDWTARPWFYESPDDIKRGVETIAAALSPASSKPAKSKPPRKLERKRPAKVRREQAAAVDAAAGPALEPSNGRASVSKNQAHKVETHAKQLLAEWEVCELELLVDVLGHYLDAQ